MKVNEVLLIDNEEDNESLLHPFQEMYYGCRFNLEPIGHKDTNNEPGDPNIVTNDDGIPFQYDGQKFFINFRKPTSQELDTMIPVILASPTKHRTDKESILKKLRRKKASFFFKRASRTVAKPPSTSTR